MRLLIAEDERITRASLVRQLQAWGHTVSAAEDGAQAWDLFGKEQFDIILTDWEMPRLSGLELIQRIRASQRQGFVYVIMLTGRSDKSDLVQGIEAGADDFVAKPFDREELRARLLAGERVVRLERQLSAQNERMRKDLKAAARVQRAMLPRTTGIAASRVRAAWTYVPTDELAGDAIGLQLIDDRYLMTYVLDVTGHGVPAALLSVTAMHALSPAREGASLLTDSEGRVRPPSRILTELNRRFCSNDNDGRFLTMILCVIDTCEGRLMFSRAGHPLPLLQRNGVFAEVDDSTGFPIGLIESGEYPDVTLSLEAGDRLFLYSDGIPEQMDAAGRAQFGESRLRELLASHAGTPGDTLVTRAVETLAGWAGVRSFADDVSLVVVEWLGDAG